MNKQPLLTILTGIPRSGKSTWVEKNKTDQDIIVSPDIIRKEIFGIQFFKQSEPFIWAYTDSLILLLAQQKKNIILDAVNMSSHIRNKYTTMVKPYNYKIRLVWLNTNLKECIKRNKTSKDKKVPLEVIKSINSGFSPIYKDRDEVIRSIGCNNEFDEIIEIRNGKTIKLK